MLDAPVPNRIVCIFDRQSACGDEFNARTRMLLSTEDYQLSSISIPSQLRRPGFVHVGIASTIRNLLVLTRNYFPGLGGASSSTYPVYDGGGVHAHAHACSLVPIFRRPDTTVNYVHVSLEATPLWLI